MTYDSRWNDCSTEPAKQLWYKNFLVFPSDDITACVSGNKKCFEGKKLLVITRTGAGRTLTRETALGLNNMRSSGFSQRGKEWMFQSIRCSYSFFGFKNQKLTNQVE